MGEVAKIARTDWFARSAGRTRVGLGGRIGVTSPITFRHDFGKFLQDVYWAVYGR
jgi:hypothetical protein